MADSTDHSEQSREQAERILSNFRQYSNYLDRAEALYERGALASAAVQCAVAAHLAVQNHCGVFWSPRAEKLLTEIARRTETPGPKHPRPREFKRILNVVTKVEAVGGHTKMLCLWVDADAGREHTLVMTGHSGPTPDRVTQAFERSGGGVRYLNRSAGDLLDRARRLRRMAQDFDLVVLHTYCEDVVPLLAFGDTGSGKYPNVLLLNHADHLFWFGPGVTHLNINLRDAAQELSIARRGIAPERNILMPTISESVTRTRSREEAKRELGISPDTVLMVSVARRLKYKTLNGVTYADIHAPILERHPDVSMIVVGAGDQPEWEPVRAKVGNRLRTTPQIPDPGIYFEAADIYLDSFPFVSSTSMMEAAGYGLPGVTIFGYPDKARIFGINHVALVGNVLQATSFDEYRKLVEALISDPAMREEHGRRSGEAVAREHNKPGWNRWMEAVYERAAVLPPLDNRGMFTSVETPETGEPDWRHEDLFGGDWPIREFEKSYVSVLPPIQRIALWRELKASGAFGSIGEALPYLAPDWLKRVAKDRLLKR